MVSIVITVDIVVEFKLGIKFCRFDFVVGFLRDCNNVFVTRRLYNVSCLGGGNSADRLDKAASTTDPLSGVRRLLNSTCSFRMR